MISHGHRCLSIIYIYNPQGHVPREKIRVETTNVRRKFDITESATQDLASDTGFLLALRNTLRLRPGAILWGGVPCSTFLG